MTERVAALPSGIDLCFETFGEPTDPTVLLVMGVGGPMGWWDTDLCRMIAERGYQVVRYDNRDTGRSTKLEGFEVSRVDVVRAWLGLGKAPYGLDALADDAFGLLDHLGVHRAHVVGVSMGGMIAQTMAIAHPERAASLVSMSSTTGRRRVGYQHASVLKPFLADTPLDRDAYVTRTIRGSALIGSPGFPTTEDVHRNRAEETYDRGWVRGGSLRHTLAVLTQPDRTRDLGDLTMPVAVVHGLRDPLVDKSGGRATAAAIPGAELLEIAGMGHDLPAPLWRTFVDVVVRTAARAGDPPRS